MGLIKNMVYRLWLWKQGYEVLRLYKHAGESGVEIGEGYVFYDITGKKIKVYVT